MREYEPGHFTFVRQSGIPRGRLGTYRRSRHILRGIAKGVGLFALGLLFYFVTNIK